MAGEEVITIMLSVGFFMGAIMMSVLVNPVTRINLMRKITKRNYGFVFFKVRGGGLIQKIKNFDNSIIRQWKGAWILKNDRIITFKHGKIVDRKPLTRKDIFYISGVPSIFLGIDDMLPLRFENEPFIEGQTRQPEQIEATLQKERSAYQAEALKMMKDKLVKYQMFTIILVILSVGMLFMVWQGLGELATKADIQSISDKIDQIYQRFPITTSG